MSDQGFDLFARPARRTLSVADLTREVKAQLESRFASVEVEGEIFNARPNTATGHWWFTMRDRGASLKCILFRSTAQRVRLKPADGVRAVARGRITVYEPGGDYQLVVESLVPVGAGELTLRFEELKKRLAAEGLFDEARKRRLPRVPRRIGVVTSPSGAAVADFLHVVQRRWPGIGVLVAPARVQGDGAAAEICRGIDALAKADDVDVVVITRGGGSIEDLWAFNEEAVARAIRRCPVPVVSGVGHETDFTIADFAADLRAPTPSAAAELVAPVRAELARELSVHKRRLWQALRRHVDVRRQRLETQRRSLSDPRRVIGERRIDLDRSFNRIERAFAERLKQHRARLEVYQERLQRAHPRARLAALAQALRGLEARQQKAVTDALRAEHRRLDEVRQRLARQHPQTMLAAQRRSLDALAGRLAMAMRQRLDTDARGLGELAGRLDAMSPLKVLSRGYALAFDEAGGLVRSAGQVATGQRVTVRVAEGFFHATVEKTGDEAP